MSKGTFLLIVSRDGQQRTHAFDKDVVTIGRSSENDLSLPDRLVSRTHCRIERSNGSFALVDAGAQNPARLRGRPVARAEIRPGETFTIGAFQLQLTHAVQETQSVDETRPGE